MTVVLVHGVPETARVWDRLRENLDRDSVALSLPGFGAPVPPGFGGGKDDHVAWLVERLRSVPGPVDLVGHDWGALLTYRVAPVFDVPLRSWAADVADILNESYVWHDLAGCGSRPATVSPS
jgi:pimeloyl-ACP methyl ester carboxylesterase